MKKLFTLSITLLLAACGHRSTKPQESVKKNSQLPQGAPVEPPAPRPIITDDQITRHILYEREMMPVAGIVVEVSLMAMKKSRGDQKQIETEVAKDPRVKRVADAEASAIAKSGISRAENQEISRIIADYIPGVVTGDAETRKRAREAFQSKYSPEALETMDKRQPELARLQNEMLAAAFNPGKRN
ncbi:hypothetical protein [Holophaga foetida]|uniref:hypothetical protein n=1 Tax=Holophaga foetida TaxID=35839 RepID=UPI000247499F|nr:hypothetical protein [Holophaga foetida]